MAGTTTARAHSQTTDHRMRLVVTGVAGAGKTTVGRLVATRAGVPFIDADDDHSADAIARMRAGLPLDEVMRASWLTRVVVRLQATSDRGFVLACSALRRAYRDRLRADVDGLVFVLLEVDPDELARRLAGRRGHFASVQLLPSQLATLERGDDLLQIDAQPPPEVVATRVLAAIELAPS